MSGTRLENAPPTVFSGFSGSPDTLKAMIRAALGPRGEQSMLVRTTGEQIVSGLRPKEYLGEILAIRNWVAEHVRYQNDSLHVEIVKDPQRLLEECQARGIAVEDCDGIALLIGALALTLGRHAEFIVAGFGEQGHYSHVFCRVKEPRSGEWIVCDPVAGDGEAEMLRKVTTYQVWSLDEVPA